MQEAGDKAVCCNVQERLRQNDLNILKTTAW